MGYKSAWYQLPARSETSVLRSYFLLAYFLPRDAFISATVVSRSGFRL